MLTTVLTSVVVFLVIALLGFLGRAIWKSVNSTTDCNTVEIKAIKQMLIVSLKSNMAIAQSVKVLAVAMKENKINGELTELIETTSRIQEEITNSIFDTK